MVGEYKPAVVWLFAAKEFDHFAEWTAAIREVSPKSRVWIQVGNVAAAVQAANKARPDVLCLQEADAGGHDFEEGAGIISWLPEVSDTFARDVILHISLVASGGVTDEHGVAAAEALGTW